MVIFANPQEETGRTVGDEIAIIGFDGRQFVPEGVDKGILPFGPFLIIKIIIVYILTFDVHIFHNAGRIIKRIGAPQIRTIR